MTEGREDWVWLWRKGGAMDGVVYRLFGLNDAGGPPIEEEPWASIRSAIYVMAREIYSLEVARSQNAIVLIGSVTSERVKAAISVLFSRHVSSVRNELEVAAPFEPAGDAASAGAAFAEESATVTRYPSITPGDVARPGGPFEFTVDLSAMAGTETQGSPVALSGLPPGWTEVRVDVEVFCDSIIFADENDRLGAVTVFRDGTSRPCNFRGRLRLDSAAGTTFRLMVTFEISGRHAGSAVRHISVEQGSDVPPPEGAIVPAGIAVVGGLRLVQGIPPATLMIKIIEGSGEKWTWSLRPNGSDARYKAKRWTEEVDLKEDTRAFARKLLQQCPTLRPGRTHASVLRGIGEIIWAVTPNCFKDLYSELRERHGPHFPIQIITDEPYVPWEMMHPDAKAGFEHADHLFMTHPMARWFGVIEGGMRERFERGLIASFVPNYADGTGLPAALVEGHRLVEEFGAEKRDPTHDNFTGFLCDRMPDKRVFVLHFAGHAASGDGHDAPGEGLRMVDGWVSSSEIHGGVKLGERDAPFVILNACSAGVSTELLGVLGGFPVNLAERGFGGILAPVWAIQDEHASSVVLLQLDGLLKRQTLGETMLDARVCYRNASATPYAYLCYGDVMARMA
jgi:CHAT domain